MKRSDFVTYLAEQVESIDKPHVVRVGIDGPDTAGKTTLADDLAVELRLRQEREVIKRDIIRISLDGFHNPREIRYEEGRLSPDGYYNDSFNYEALRTLVLDSLGPGGSGYYIQKLFDHRSNMPEPTNFKKAEGDEILVMDGIFLLRPELKGRWDYSVFLDIDRKIAMERALLRDGKYLGDSNLVRVTYNKRYFPAQERYLREADPKNHADLVADNNDPENPQILSEVMRGK